MFKSWIRALSGMMGAFVKSKRANVAMIFGLSAIPIAIAAGTGIDLSRALVVRARLAEALDAAGLAVGSSSSMTQSQAQTLAQQYFNANYNMGSGYGTPSAVTATLSNGKVVLSANVPMPTTLMNIVGIHTITVASTSQIVWGQTKLWVALVLDNTGSMCQSDSDPNNNGPCPNPSSGSKIAVLKTATNNLLAMLKNASANPGDVKAAIVPFTKDVNVGGSNYQQGWIDWTDWNIANGTCSVSSKHTQSSCTSTHGTWTNGSCNISGINSQSTCTSTHGTWTANRHGSGGSCSISGYNTQSSCQNAVGSWTPGTCSFSGYNTQSACQSASAVWTPNSHSTWTGCVMDRGNESGPDTTHNYDAMNTTPSSGVTASQFPAEQYSSCPEQLLTLTSVLNGGSVDSSLTSEVNSMVANGNTNQTIGFVWGWQALTDGDPLNAGTLPAETQKIVILLSDGLNTQNRWSSSQNSIDTREELACDDAKHDGVTIYSVFVDIGGTQGSSDALQYCAGSTPGQGDSSKYYDLTSASQITVAFTEIGTEITKLRVAQ